MGDVTADQPFTHGDAEQLLESHDRLSRQIDELKPELDRLTVRLDNIKIKAEKADRVARSNERVVRGLVAAVVVIVCLTIGAIMAIRAARQQTTEAAESIERAEQAISDIERTRLEARQVTCEQFNSLLDAIEIKITSAGSAAILTLVPEAETPDDLTPDLRDAYERYRDALAADNSLTNRRRDCSPEGIAAYYDRS